MMNKKVNSTILAFVLALSGQAEVISSNFQSLLSHSYFKHKSAELRLVNYGVPNRVLESQEFEDFTLSISNDLSGCLSVWQKVATNSINCILFRSALAKCGPEKYTSFITNALVQNAFSVTTNKQDELFWYMSGACTPMNNYFMLNYSVPGISNLWLAVRKFYSQNNQTNQVEWVDDVLSGKRKWEWENINNTQTEENE
jgi:hypothetical protein